MTKDEFKILQVMAKLQGFKLRTCPIEFFKQWGKHSKDMEKKVYMDEHQQLFIPCKHHDKVFFSKYWTKPMEDFLF